MLGHTDVSKPKEWTANASRLIFFLGANNVTDPTRRRAAPLRFFGGAVFNLTQALISPSNPNEKFFDEILFILERHSSPQSSQIVAQGCNFSDLEIMLRD
ncbi:Spike glycoprotein [Trichinella pseudospiralis]